MYGNSTSVLYYISRVRTKLKQTSSITTISNFPRRGPGIAVPPPPPLPLSILILNGVLSGGLSVH